MVESDVVSADVSRAAQPSRLSRAAGVDLHTRPSRRRWISPFASGPSLNRLAQKIVCFSLELRPSAENEAIGSSTGPPRRLDLVSPATLCRLAQLEGVHEAFDLDVWLSCLFRFGAFISFEGDDKRHLAHPADECHELAAEILRRSPASSAPPQQWEARLTRTTSFGRLNGFSVRWGLKPGRTAARPMRRLSAQPPPLRRRPPPACPG